jgi:hypothetical protein
MPASTVRAWLIGLIWAALIPGVNQFFFFRYPTVGLPVRFVLHDFFPQHLHSMLSCTPYEQFIPLLLSFPIGKLLALYVPNVTLFGLELNPGPFTIKEHVIITIMASVASAPAYAVSTGFSIQPVLRILMPAPRLDRYCCRPKGLLQPESQLCM